MKTPNYSEVIKSYKSLCNKIYDILLESYNYFDNLHSKVKDILNKENLSESSESYFKDLINYASKISEMLGLKNVYGIEEFLSGNFADVKQDFIIKRIKYGTKLIDVEVYNKDDEYDSDFELKIPTAYLDNKSLLKKKYEKALKNLEKKAKTKTKSKIKEFIPPKIELKDKLEKALEWKKFNSEKDLYNFVFDYAKDETFVTAKYEDGRLIVAYKNELMESNKGICGNYSLSMFTIPVTIEK